MSDASNQQGEDLHGKEILCTSARCEEREDGLCDVKGVTKGVIGRVGSVDGATFEDKVAELCEIDVKLFVQSKVNEKVFQHGDENVVTVETPQIEFVRFEALFDPFVER